MVEIKIFNTAAIFIAVIVLVIAVAIMLNLSKIDSNLRDQGPDEEETNPEDDGPDFDEDGENADPEDPNSFTGGGGGSGGGSGGSTSTSEEPDYCYQQISYSLRNFISNSECNEYSGSNCIDKSITCSVTVENLDSNISGNFEILFKILSNNEVLSSRVITNLLNPDQSLVFETTFQVTGINADKNIDCSSTSNAIPTRYVC